MTNPHKNQTRMVAGEPEGETKLADAAPEAKKEQASLKRLKALRPFRLDTVDAAGRKGVRHVEAGEIVEVDSETAQKLIREIPGQYGYMGEMYQDTRHKVKLAEPAL